MPGHIAIAGWHGNKGELDRAIEDFNTVIKLNPNLTQAYNSRGNAYYLKGNYDRAIENYITIAELLTR